MSTLSYEVSTVESAVTAIDAILTTPKANLASKFEALAGVHQFLSDVRGRTQEAEASALYNMGTIAIEIAITQKAKKADFNHTKDGEKPSQYGANLTKSQSNKLVAFAFNKKVLDCVKKYAKENADGKVNQATIAAALESKGWTSVKKTMNDVRNSRNKYPLNEAGQKAKAKHEAIERDTLGDAAKDMQGDGLDKWLYESFPCYRKK